MPLGLLVATASGSVSGIALLSELMRRPTGRVHPRRLTRGQGRVTEPPICRDAPSPFGVPSSPDELGSRGPDRPKTVCPTDDNAHAQPLECPNNEDATRVERVASGVHARGAIVMMCVSPSDDDLALLSAHLRGDESAFAILMVRYQGRLRGMCWNYLHDAEMVEDVLQDTFCQVLERIPRVDGDLNLSAWVHRIAANLCIDELRRRGRRAELQTAGDAEPALSSVVDEDRLGRPEEAFDLDVTRRLVRAAILQLPERQRDVLILRDVCGRSEAETARALGSSTGAVQGILHRARESFRETYIALESDEALPGECGQVAFVFEHLRLASLRKDRLGAVERHVGECRWCRARFGRAVSLGSQGATVSARLAHLHVVAA